MQEASLRKKPLYFFTGNSEQQRANAAVLVSSWAAAANLLAGTRMNADALFRLQVGLYQVLLMDRTPELAFQIVKGLGPFAHFRDASCGQSCFDLTVLDCLKVMHESRCPTTEQKLFFPQFTNPQTSSEHWYMYRAYTKPAKLDLWTGTYPHVHLMWKSMSSMSRFKMETSIG